MQRLVQTRAALFVVLSIGALAQSEDGGAKFEVASVRPVTVPARPIPVMTGGPGTVDPGRIRFIAPMNRLLQAAFGLDRFPDRLSGPDWIGSEWYEVTASLPAAATKEQSNQMLVNLLADRFGLKFHHQSRNVSGYELVIAQGGPKLKVAGDSNAPPPTAGASLPRQTFDKDGYPEFPPGVSGTGFSPSENGTMHVAGKSQSIDDLILTILTSLNDGKRVADKTGLTGKYDFKMDLDDGGGFRRPGLGPRPVDDPMGPDIFTALEKSLGLKLQKAQISIDVVVIDHLEKAPSEN